MRARVRKQQQQRRQRHQRRQTGKQAARLTGGYATACGEGLTCHQMSKENRLSGFNCNIYISLYIPRLWEGPPLQPFFRSRSPHFSSFFSKIVNKGKPFLVWSTTAEIFRHLRSLFLLCFWPVSSGTPLELYNFLAVKWLCPCVLLNWIGF